MAVVNLAFDEFAKDFSSSLMTWHYDAAPYCLVLGSGASRSAGIPLARDMVTALQKLARRHKLRVGRPKGESPLSWYFRHIFGPIKQNRPRRIAGLNGRDFLLGCIRRAEREPNLTHLIAAYMAGSNIVNPIVTTNYDDLLLGAFWQLPSEHLQHEPHIIYDPRDGARSMTRVAPDVPIVIKAHGHHTTYGMGILDRQVESLAPAVNRLLRKTVQPGFGYIVMGYSGAWDDGIMRFFCHLPAALKRPIYWLHRGTAIPTSPQIKQLTARQEVFFVSIDDSDLAMYRLWREVPDYSYDGGETHAGPEIGRVPFINFDEGGFVSTPPYRHRWSRTVHEISWNEWLDCGLVSEGGLPLKIRNPGRWNELKRKLGPILQRLDQLDQATLISDCVDGWDSLDSEDAARFISSVEQHFPVDVVWTRRNLAILRLAFREGLTPEESTSLMSAFMDHFLTSVGGSVRRILRPVSPERAR